VGLGGLSRSMKMSVPFHSLHLPAPVLKGTEAAGFTHCTPIQELTLPLILEGRDVAGQAQTGTGKTAAFLIGCFTRLLRSGRVGSPGRPRAIIVAPTRELAVQIHEDARLLGQFTALKFLAVYGGIDYHQQREALRQPVDIVVGTPGRLIDYLKQGVYHLKAIEAVVIDEADRMFDMGFIADIRYILRRLPPYHARQSLLFSATLGYREMELAYEFMNDPIKVSATPDQLTVPQVEEVLYHVARDEKFSLLLGLLKRERGGRVLIFTNTKRAAQDLANRLTLVGYESQAITGDLDQRKRLQVMKAFKAGELPILVATDVASRGLHIEGVTHVVNFDVPQDPEDYVHRIGRTARAGAAGKAMTLADERYVLALPVIEALIGHKIPVEWPAEEHFIRTAPHPRPSAGERRGGRRGRRHRTPSA
jgi:ATP-dependent RNA helicase RhlB